MECVMNLIVDGGTMMPALRLCKSVATNLIMQSTQH